MSAKRVKRETVNLITPDRSERINNENIPTECDRLRKEITHKNEVQHIVSIVKG
jgi:hypothetical protein